MPNDIVKSNSSGVAFNTSTFKKECLNALLSDDNYPFVLVYKTKGAVAISISDNIKDKNELAQYIFNFIKANKN